MICKDEDGGYFAYATRLPGVVGEGDTFQEAVDSVREGFESVLSGYLAVGEIPWQDEDTHEQGILVSLAIRVDG
jgi:predicted RNase H-like HicB family nuclease